MNKKIDLKDAFFHGLGGEEISFVMFPKTALHISMLKLDSIIKNKGIYSREMQKKLNIGYLEFGYHSNLADVDNVNNYVSICKRVEEAEESAFETFIEGKISIALNPNIASNYDFRSEKEYYPDVGEKQVLDCINISDFIAIVVDIESEEYTKTSIDLISKLLERYRVENIPITDLNGQIIKDISKEMEI